MDETPSTFLVWFDRHPAFTLVIISAITLAGIALVYVFARLLIGSLQKSARYDQPLTTLMLILGTISIVALIGALFTNNESAFTIAATGVGAFAGALSAGAQKVIADHYTEPAPAPLYPEPIGPALPVENEAPIDLIEPEVDEVNKFPDEIPVEPGDDAEDDEPAVNQFTEPADNDEDDGDEPLPVGDWKEKP